MCTPSFSLRGENSLLFKRMEGQTENFTPPGPPPPGGEHSILFRWRKEQTENFTPGNNFTPRGQNSPLGDNFAPGGQSLLLVAKLRMSLSFSLYLRTKNRGRFFRQNSAPKVVDKLGHFVNEIFFYIFANELA
jgi:hypothetical protein